MKLRIVTRKTKGGLFVQFDLLDPGDAELDGLLVEPAGEHYRLLLKLEEALRAKGGILDSPDTGFVEKIESMSDTSSVIGGYFEVRDEKASEVFVAALRRIFPAAELEEEDL
jgi:hypothetical protein